MDGLPITPMSRGIQSALAIFGTIQQMRAQQEQLELAKRRELAYEDDRRRARDSEDMRTRMALNQAGARPMTATDRFEDQSGQSFTAATPIVGPGGAVRFEGGTGGGLFSSTPSDIAGRKVVAPGSTAPWVLPSQDELEMADERRLRRRGALDAETARIRAEADAQGRIGVYNSRAIPVPRTVAEILGMEGTPMVQPEALDDYVRAAGSLTSSKTPAANKLTRTVTSDDGTITKFYSDGSEEKAAGRGKTARSGPRQENEQRVAVKLQDELNKLEKEEAAAHADRAQQGTLLNFDTKDLQGSELAAALENKRKAVGSLRAANVKLADVQTRKHQLLKQRARLMGEPEPAAPPAPKEVSLQKVEEYAKKAKLTVEQARKQVEAEGWLVY
jgi:hypothetical protein